MTNSEIISVQVAYASANCQEIISINIPVKSTVEHAINESGILLKCSEIDLSVCAVGIYGKVIENDCVLKDQDRVEIYRPLTMDPMDARRKRAGLQH